jgi:hypothetical protein
MNESYEIKFGMKSVSEEALKEIMEYLVSGLNVDYAEFRKVRK